MASLDATIFKENLKLWDRPLSELRGNHILQKDDNVECIIEEMFDRLMDTDNDCDHPLVGNC